MPKERPRIVVNFAITADGKVSTRNHTPTGFTSAEDKRRLRAIRSIGDAVLVGAGTVAADRMTMGLSDLDLRKVRTKRGQQPEPIRVLISNSGRLDPKWRVFAYTSSPLLVFSTQRMSQALRIKLAPLCDLWLFNQATVDLREMLRILRQEYRVRTMVCEGGPTLFRSLLEIGAVDELCLTWAPLLFGGKDAPSVTGLPGEFLPKLVRCRLKKMEPFDEEVFLRYQVRHRD
jgi:riboflavin-specific deaminase-like protein